MNQSEEHANTPGMPENNDAKLRAAIDQSCKQPVLLFFATGLMWLLIGSVLGVIDSWKLHNPGFFTGLFGCDFAWMSYGRLHPVFNNIMIYGWGLTSSFGVVIWLMARLCRSTVCCPNLLSGACLIWNVGVIVGSFSVLSGTTTGLLWMEYPRYAHCILFVAYFIVAASAIHLFVKRKTSSIYISIWYLLAALFWFPWVYITAISSIEGGAFGGVASNLLNSWFSQSLIGLWFVPVGLAAAYYMIPKVLGRPVHSYHLATFGFWSLAVFYSWNGAYRMIGGPVPAWIITVSVAASILTLIPVAIVAVNHHMTLGGRYEMLTSSPTLRFVTFGAVIYTLASGLITLTAFRSVNQYTQFTLFNSAYMNLMLYAFFGMILFGCIYYIVPRLVGCEWIGAWMIKFHFMTTAYALLTAITMMVAAGFFQGSFLNDASINFKNVILATEPYLVTRTLALVILIVPQLLFAFHFLLMLLKLGRPTGGPTLLAEVENENVATAEASA